MRFSRQRRKGNVLVFAAALMVASFAFLAFALDLGYLSMARSQLQTSADASALAAASELIDTEAIAGHGDPVAAETRARTVAGQYAAANLVTGDASELAVDDVGIGCIANPFVSGAEILPGDPSSYNAVRIRVRRTSDINGEVPLFFARAMGFASAPSQAEATAVFIKNIGGFTTPPGDDTLEILPFALDLGTWEAMLDGTGADNWTWTWDDVLKKGVVSSGPDGILEVNLFPQGTASPGNRGTVDIGPSNNSTCDLARQIRYGISHNDMVALEATGRSLVFDENGEVHLNGDTGISAGVKDDLVAIKGQGRVIPLFSSVAGPGNNAEYTIVQYVGVHILDVKLTGSMSSKRVIVQPANVSARYAVPATGDQQKSCFVYSPVWLIK